MLAGAGALVVAGLVLWSAWPESTPTSATAAGVRFPWEMDPLPRSLVALDEIVSGGPPPDGIPPIDRPKFVTVRQAGAWLADEEPVLLLERGGDARAYPLQIMTWHEIVNDVVGGDPITVTFCPLCNSAIAFEREHETTREAGAVLGKRAAVLDFGTSGRLYRSNLVMYDRQTKSLWIQFTGKAVAGPFVGAELEKVPVQIVAWDQFSRAHPDGRVLPRDTGNPRDYGSNPYAGYDSVDSSPFLYTGPNDGRLRPMERVVTVSSGKTSRAFTYRALRKVAAEGAAVVGENDLVVFYQRGTVSALDETNIASSSDVGATGVFRPAARGRALTFRVEKGKVLDEQTGSAWSIEGRATHGPLRGAKLEPVVHDDTFWFVWAAFRPQTSIWDG
jgi:hypothetical protein